ncbi:serine/threonine-protein kinase [Chromatium okenii]|uniref:Protein kinase domain-containing protein n=1 Tax=Chromatium okenii TaxID=61644 RepID=A0A2S7XS04_9GAMM|nr:serine/threonine-protein kinase [Chromatium okenii]MBV5308695.1 serine/threonine protein kinase [Chromatium okenii]PQJ96517.1 hypothetical protein CXB77_06665 [Chromatium okenii]
MDFDSTIVQPVMVEPMSLESLRLGLQPRYRLERELGAGGMGQVFLATDTDLERRVAIKTILPELVCDADWVSRLRLEARVAAGLQHPNLVQVFEILTVGATPVIVMEYVPGRTLTEMLGEGWLTPLHLTSLMAEICDGIAYAHARGVIHRDLKPANILLSRAGQPKVSDFGLAVRRQAGEQYRHHVGDERIIGSPFFMSPEQALNGSQLPDTRSDIYSLGATLYYGLTGRAPVNGKTTEDVIGAVIHQTPPRPSTLGINISPDLEAICFKALLKDPAQRYATAAEMAEDLRRSLGGLPVTARRYHLWEAAGRAMKARKEALAVGLALILLMMTGLYAAVSLLTTTAENALMGEIRRKVIDIATLSTMMIDPTLVETAIDSGSRNHVRARQLAAQLNTICHSTTGVRFLYILRQPRRNDPQLEFVVTNASFLSDAELDLNQNGLVDTDEAPSMPGDPFDATPYPAMLLGFQKPTADKTTENLDQWGIALSGYAPIRGNDGHSIGVLGVDISSLQLRADFESLEQSRNLALLVTVGLAVLSLILLLSTLVGLWNRDRLPTAVTP